MARVTAEGFEGTLSEAVTAGAFAASRTATARIAPRSFNAPREAPGTTPQGRFLRAPTSTKPLTFTTVRELA